MLALAVASSCGFHPLYEPTGTQLASLASVYVEIIPNRSGQLLRQALQARIEGSTSNVEKHYTLSVSYFETGQALGVQRDNSTTRTRLIGTAAWSLRSVDNSVVQVAGGTVRNLDGYNVIDEQFFYGDLSQEEVQRRQAEALADQILTSLAAYFSDHAKRARG